MAGVLNIHKFPLLRSVHGSPKTPRKSFPIIRATSETPTSSTSTSVTAPPNFEPPKPKRFAVRPDKTWDIIGASLALFFRLGTGVFVNGYSVSFVSKDAIPPDQYSLEVSGYKVKETSKLGPRPEKPIEIYEFEGCPFCRKVREIVAVLDLDVLFYPCPQNGPTFRPKVVQMGGKKQFPYMVDPNTGTAMYESDDIIKYLVQKYGDGSIPFMLSLGLLTTLTEGFAMIGRMGKGSSYTPSKLPPKPVELWAYEGSPFCKIVREVLVELELPHIFRSCARGSPKRQILFEKTGHFQAPYIEDPNTGVQMFESAEIVEYLKATYASS
ncbi:THIOREDOXIN FAMILY PROTEIN [Salix viminalis]|uniref:THIOREDOXIN FAMILY PROTEIN n=1 Tax=Salix viminalis TaxID=40686 RepID=A0A6N2MQ26_SALVM|nr:THIOREDOXIN FAMILY PROTEIN [Salix viminalis]